jgi:hypothetical protein
MDNDRVQVLKELLGEWRKKREEATHILQRADAIIPGLEQALAAITGRGVPMTTAQPRRRRRSSTGEQVLTILHDRREADVNEIHTALREQFGNTITKQALYAQLGRLDDAGRIKELPAKPGPRRAKSYRITDKEE